MLWPYRPADCCSCNAGADASGPSRLWQLKVQRTCYNRYWGEYVFLLFQVF
jgi:hypothetical protein